MRYYKPTEAELDRLGELSKDEAAARGAMGFCIGLVVNVVLGLMFAVGLSTPSRAVGATIGIIAAIGAVKFGLDAHKKRGDGNSALEKVKADHDFTDI